MKTNDNYTKFMTEISKTEARGILDMLVRNYATVKRQNSKILKRLADIVNNHKYYLQKRLPARGGYKEYEAERLKFLRQFNSVREKMDKLVGRIYIDEDENGEPKYFVKMSKTKILKLLEIVK